MSSTTIPPAAKRGSTIGLICPSARLHKIFPLRISRAIAFLESLNFRVKKFYPDDTGADIPYTPLSANATARAEEVHRAFRDEEVRIVICCIGGSSMNELLPYLDAEIHMTLIHRAQASFGTLLIVQQIIRANPKILIGSSDITLLHHFCYTAAGLRTFYGPSIITQFGEWPVPLSFTSDHFLSTLVGEQSGQPVGLLPRSAEFTDEFCDWATEAQRIEEGNMRKRTMRPARGWRWLREGTAEGLLWGGCLPSVLQLMGTKWQVSYKGKIALLELPEGDVDGKGIPLERAMWHFNDFRIRGVLDDIVGLVLGRPYLYTEAEEEAWEERVLRATEDYEFPILAGVDVGHSDPMLTVPLGARMRLDSERDAWEVLDPAVVQSV